MTTRVLTAAEKRARDKRIEEQEREENRRRVRLRRRIEEHQEAKRGR